MIGILTYLGIFITCLGLWGLSSLSTEQRVKEIGIRKILGASVPGVLLLLSKEFARWVIAASVIACPIGYFVMRKWMEKFAYRTQITPPHFPVVCCVRFSHRVDDSKHADDEGCPGQSCGFAAV